MMRRHWLLITLGALLLALATTAMACGDDDDDDDDDVAPVATTAAADDDGEGGDEVTELSADIEGIDNEISGTATLTTEGGETQVVVELDGVPAGAHANHLHHGSCAEQGEVHVPLDEVEATEGETVEVTTTFADPMLDHFAEGHYYAIHEGDNDTVGAVIACGDIS